MIVRCKSPRAHLLRGPTVTVSIPSGGDVVECKIVARGDDWYELDVPDGSVAATMLTMRMEQPEISVGFRKLTPDILTDCDPGDETS